MVLLVKNMHLSFGNTLLSGKCIPGVSPRRGKATIVAGFFFSIE